MLNINKLNDKFEEILESMTPAEMQKWLDNKNKEEITNNLNKGMDKNTIKKALYKQKPMAERRDSDEVKTTYLTEIEVEGEIKQINFVIPRDELFDEHENFIFAEHEPAQLLIRWLEL